MKIPGIKEWGGHRCPAWLQRFRAWLFPDSQPCRSEPGFDIDPADTSRLRMTGDKGRLTRNPGDDSGDD